MNEENIIHKRLVTFTPTLKAFLYDLGYELKFTSGNDLKRIQIFFKNGKYVAIGFNGLALFYSIKDKMEIAHQGLTVHDELLKFFTNRDYGHDKAYNENLSRMFRDQASGGSAKSKNKHR